MTKTKTDEDPNIRRASGSAPSPGRRRIVSAPCGSRGPSTTWKALHASHNILQLAVTPTTRGNLWYS